MHARRKWTNRTRYMAKTNGWDAVDQRA